MCQHRHAKGPASQFSQTETPGPDDPASSDSPQVTPNPKSPSTVQPAVAQSTPIANSFDRSHTIRRAASATNTAPVTVKAPPSANALTAKATIPGKRVKVPRHPPSVLRSSSVVSTSGNTALRAAGNDKELDSFGAVLTCIRPCVSNGSSDGSVVSLGHPLAGLPLALLPPPQRLLVRPVLHRIEVGEIR